MNNELLVFGSREEVEVKCIGNLGLIKSVKVFANFTNIIVSVNELQLLGYVLTFRNTRAW